MRAEVELQGTEMTFGRMLNISFCSGSSGGPTTIPSLTFSESSDKSISLIYNNATVISGLVTKAYIEQLNLGSGQGSTVVDLFGTVFDIIYDTDGKTPLSIKAKYDLWGVGSIAAGGPGSGGYVGPEDPGEPGEPGEGGTQVSWGTTENNYVALSVASVTKSLALLGHEHDYTNVYAPFTHSHSQYRETTDNVFQNSITLKSGENTVSIAIDSQGRIYVNKDFYSLGAVAAGGPGGVEGGSGGEGGTTVEWAESTTAGYGLLRVGLDDVSGTLVALSSHTHDYVPTSTEINGNKLTGNITLTASSLGAVPTTRTINNKALSADITLSASDVGASAAGHNHDSLYSYAYITPLYPAVEGAIQLFFKQQKSNALYDQYILPLYANTRLKSSGDFTNISSGISVKEKIVLKYSDTVFTALKIDKNGAIYVDGNFYATGSVAAGAAGSTPSYATIAYVDSAIENAVLENDLYATKDYVTSAIATALAGFEPTGGTPTGTLGVAQGGTGLTTLTSGYALVGNGTGAVSLRNILNNTKATEVGKTTDLITANTLFYHIGSTSVNWHAKDLYLSGTTSIYFGTKVGISGDSSTVTLGVSDKTLSLKGTEVSIGADIIPETSLVHSLGSSSKPFKNIYASSITIGGVTLSYANNSLKVDKGFYALGGVAAGELGQGYTPAIKAAGTFKSNVHTAYIGSSVGVGYSSNSKNYQIIHMLNLDNYIIIPVGLQKTGVVNVAIADKGKTSVKVVFTDSSGAQVENDFDYIII